jgi:VCBS repeat-containing protein
MNSPYIANCDADPNVPDKCSSSGEAGHGFYGSGMTSIWGGGSHKLGPYDDAEARHQFMQSGFHRSVDFCGTCHDVSNPAVGDLAPGNGAQPGAPHVISSQPVGGGTPNLGGPIEEKAAFNNPPYAYGVVERTFSEYKASAYPTTLVSQFGIEPGLQDSLPEDLHVAGGSLDETYQAAMQAGTGGNYADGTPRYFSCQSCHMRPVQAFGCNKKGAPERLDMPMHDQTGGNYWFADVVQYQDSNNQLRLGGGLTDNQRLAMDLGKVRAVKHLQQAAGLTVTGNILKVVNLTGHKLISGYPEGRRMWLNIRWYDGNGAPMPAHEIGKYGSIGVSIPNPAGGPDVEVESIVDLDDSRLRLYEAHYAMTQEWAALLTSEAVGYSPNIVLSYDRGAGLDTTGNHTLGDLAAQAPGTYHETFHFVLNNHVSGDNRIPPYGMSFDEAKVRNALPVPADQYGAGTAGSIYEYWDTVDIASLAPPGAEGAEIDLLYQGTSWEYIQFLNNNNNGQNAFLADEGVNMLDAWINAEIQAPSVLVVNGDTKMVPPVVMQSTTWGTVPSGGQNEAPTANNDSFSVNEGDTLNGNVLTNDSDADGDTLTATLIDNAATGQLTLSSDGSFVYIPDASADDSFTYVADDGTVSSNVATVSITVNAIGGGTNAGVAAIETGFLEGKGKNRIFVPEVLFAPGDTVVIRATVESGGQPVPNATVTLDIAGRDGAVITSGPSDANGIAEASWNTSATNKKGNGGTAPGSYTVTTINVEATGFTWDGVPTNTSITLQ